MLLHIYFSLRNGGSSLLSLSPRASYRLSSQAGGGGYHGQGLRRRGRRKGQWVLFSSVIALTDVESLF